MAAVNVWGEILRSSIVKREDAVSIVESVYRSMNVEPIRGASRPPDIFDKEMITIYVIGKWGLGLDKEVPTEIINSVFGKEILIERLYSSILQYDSREDVCRGIDEICRGIDDSLIARTLRFAFTLYYFDYIGYAAMVSFIRKLYKLFPEFQETVRRFVKFVVAYEVGTRISSGRVRSDIELNMAKNVIALEIGIPKALPSINYIVEVSKHFFTMQEDTLKSLKTSTTGKEALSE